MPCKAYEVPCGHLVVVVAAGELVVALKVERNGKDYIHHYAVPLHPRHAPGGLALIYLDPEDRVTDLGHGIRLDPGPAEPLGAAVAAGDLFCTPRGWFLKLIDDPRNAKPHTYVDPIKGELLNRQERDIESVHRSWRVAEVSLDAIMAGHRRS